MGRVVLALGMLELVATHKALIKQNFQNEQHDHRIRSLQNR